MNIYDISERAGVSIATVSRVLNGNSSVSEKTRQKILTVMEETGYRPNVFARGLGLNTMNTVGILCADSSDSVLASAVYHVEQELRQHKYDALLCCTGYETAEKEKCLKLLLSKRVDALILVGSNFVEEDMEKNRYIIEGAEQVPVILINGYLDAPNIYGIVHEDAEAMYSLTRRFLTHTDRILHVYRSRSYSGRQKIRGIRQAFEEAGKEFLPEQCILFNGTIKETGQMLLQRWEKGERWDVILASDDELAAGAYKFARAAALKVPDEIQITGYNNSKISICCEPEISSVDNHMEYTSRSAVEALMRVLAGEKVPARVSVSCEIIARDTTKRI